MERVLVWTQVGEQANPDRVAMSSTDQRYPVLGLCVSPYD
jgi:hypothetical protein